MRTKEPPVSTSAEEKPAKSSPAWPTPPKPTQRESHIRHPGPGNLAVIQHGKVRARDGILQDVVTEAIRDTHPTPNAGLGEQPPRKYSERDT